MQPAAADVEGDIRRRPAAAADAVARFQHDYREAGVFQRPRRAEACGAGADDGDIDFGGEGHDVVYFIVMAGPSPAMTILGSVYATASLAFTARLRSLASSNFLRSRIDFGVTSTSSSSSI